MRRRDSASRERAGVGWWVPYLGSLLCSALVLTACGGSGRAASHLSRQTTTRASSTTAPTPPDTTVQHQVTTTRATTTVASSVPTSPTTGTGPIAQLYVTSIGQACAYGISIAPLASSITTVGNGKTCDVPLPWHGKIAVGAGFFFDVQSSPDNLGTYTCKVVVPGHAPVTAQSAFPGNYADCSYPPVPASVTTTTSGPLLAQLSVTSEGSQCVLVQIGTAYQDNGSCMSMPWFGTTLVGDSAVTLTAQGEAGLGMVTCKIVIPGQQPVVEQSGSGTEATCVANL